MQAAFLPRKDHEGKELEADMNRVKLQIQANNAHLRNKRTKERARNLRFNLCRQCTGA